MRTRVAALSLSAVALVGIAVHEGYRSDAYLDSVGVPTIGYGTTQGVKLGQSITPERALVRLLADADKMQRDMRSCLGDVPLFQHEWDAYVSLAYNIGTGAWCKSTMVRLLKQNPPQYTAACDQILRWSYAGGRQLPGLVKRRQDEHAKCRGV